MAIGVNPFDVGATGEALHQALAMPAAERAARAGELRRRAEAHTAAGWLEEQRRVARSLVPAPS